jgi:uncharacterized protein YjdB
MLLITFESNAAPTIFYVATSGSDNNPGTLTQPFATIEKARQTIRPLNSTMTDDIIINIRGGTYTLDSTFTLSNLDKASNGYSIIYQNYNCEKVVLSGGKKITGWTLHDSGKNIYQANVGSVDSRQLYVNGVRAIRARSVNGTGWSESGTGYTCPSSVALWGNIADVEVVSFSYWKCHRGKIASVTGTHATMSEPYWTNLHAQYNAPPKWIENAYELLDAEGEWYLDRNAGILYYKPLSSENINTAEVILPVLETLVKGSDLVNVQFRGITFAHATWLGSNTSNGFPCVQAEALFTTPSLALDSFFQIPGNITFDHCENMIFENNTFEHLGVSALQLFRGCKNNRVYNNTFQDISGSGITIGSIHDATPLATDSVKDNTIDNNLITRVAVEYVGCVGIFVAYTEHTIITRNEIRNLPYTGISAGWGWSNVLTVQKNNEISYNRIDSVMTALIDGGGIYTLSAQPGAQVHDNYISHQFHEYGTLYPDEGSSYMHWHHNVVKNVIRWLHMWTSSIQNDTVDFNYYDNTTQTLNGTGCIVQNNTYVTGNNWPPAALAIMSNSGRTGVSVQNVCVSPVTLNLTVNDTSRLIATITPDDASNKNVVWSSSNSTIASVDSSGLVTANDTGTATITVTTIDGSKTATAIVIVTAATGITEHEFNSLSIFPNPSHSNCMICYSLLHNAEVSINIYDAVGKEVLVITNERQASGPQCFDLAYKSLDSGIYSVRLNTRDHQTIKKFIVSK